MYAIPISPTTTSLSLSLSLSLSPHTHITSTYDSGDDAGRGGARDTVKDVECEDALEDEEEESAYVGHHNVLPLARHPPVRLRH